MAGCLSQAWIASIVEDLRQAMGARAPDLVAREAQGSSPPGASHPCAASGGSPIDALRQTVEDRKHEGPLDLREDRAWQERFHTAMAAVILEEYGAPVPNRHGPFVPEHFTADIMALTRGMF
ncbi:MAG TPA: hypothetical protein PKX87_01275 [Alphaproteobacteria bacterium]|nr:hypothetical protein [Alphaproteobacteria bacterium]